MKLGPFHTELLLAALFYNEPIEVSVIFLLVFLPFITIKQEKHYGRPAKNRDYGGTAAMPYAPLKNAGFECLALHRSEMLDSGRVGSQKTLTHRREPFCTC